MFSSADCDGQASAYVPLDDIAYTYVDALMARGLFRELSALERPFTERRCAVAVDSARTREPGAMVSSYLDALYRPSRNTRCVPGIRTRLQRRLFARAVRGICTLTAPDIRASGAHAGRFGE